MIPNPRIDLPQLRDQANGLIRRWHEQTGRAYRHVDLEVVEVGSTRVRFEVMVVTEDGSRIAVGRLSLDLPTLIDDLEEAAWLSRPGPEDGRAH